MAMMTREQQETNAKVEQLEIEVKRLTEENETIIEMLGKMIVSSGTKYKLEAVNDLYPQCGHADTYKFGVMTKCKTCKQMWKTV